VINNQINKNKNKNKNKKEKNLIIKKLKNLITIKD